MQVDNPLQHAAYPIMLKSPNMQSRYSIVPTAVAAAATAALPKPAALCLRWSLWRSRPGHVLCVERLEIQTAAVLVEVEQAHAVQLLHFSSCMLAPVADESQSIRYQLFCTPSYCLSAHLRCLACVVDVLCHTLTDLSYNSISGIELAVLKPK